MYKWENSVDSVAAPVTDLDKKKQLSVVLAQLRIPEKILLGFFTYLATAAFLFPLEARQRAVVVAVNLLAGFTILLLSEYGLPARSRFLGVVRDWLPCVLILVAYRQSGLLFTPDPTHRLDHLFIAWDDLLLKQPWVAQVLSWGAPWVQRYLEFAYFLCYPIVPLGLASLYLVRRSAPALGARASCPSPSGTTSGVGRSFGPAIEHFWTAVLLASFTCYLLFPLFPLTPPRELFNDIPGPRVVPMMRGMNFWLLGHYAVGASLFPSAHVAATTAMALTIRRYLPRFGWIFIAIAASIALATVYGRYHYAADALAGALVGIAAYWVATRLQ